MFGNSLYLFHIQYKQIYFILTAQETPPPPLIVPEPNPSNSPSEGIPNLPDDTEPDAASGQGEDILYITLGVVLGAMLLVLIMFGVMCIWRAKQVNSNRMARK